jgi:hypothetical protein
MSSLRLWYVVSLALALSLAAPIWLDARSAPATPRRFDGFNVIAVPGHPFGGEAAWLSLAYAKRQGARAIAIVPFFWQPTPASPKLQHGNDMTDAELRAAIRDAHALGLAVLVKPQVWVPDNWAGAVAMGSEADWHEWFANYQRELENVARTAAQEKAEALVIGTELAATEKRPEWVGLISAVRGLYSGHLLYAAHNVEEAETVPFWDQLDAIGVTLYPPLGPDADRKGRRTTMRLVADRLVALAALRRKPVLVGEIGLRSAVDAAAKPWESAEERDSTPDPALQAAVIADWLAALDRPSVEGVLIWRWLTDPAAGGLTDTDFTVQGKPAEHVLMCEWTKLCNEDHARLRLH